MLSVAACRVFHRILVTDHNFVGAPAPCQTCQSPALQSSLNTAVAQPKPEGSHMAETPATWGCIMYGWQLDLGGHDIPFSTQTCS